MTTNTISWNKIITVCSAFGIPIMSIVIAGVIWGVRLDDKLTTVIINQDKQGIKIEDLNYKIDQLSIRVDTVTQRQKDAKRESDYRFMYLEHNKANH